MDEYIPRRCRLFIRRTGDREGVKRCMVGGVVLDDLGLEMDNEQIWDGAILLMPDRKVDVPKDVLPGYRIDQVMCSDYFANPEPEENDDGA